jgi:tetratricopeptide (TPR) repeat protein
MTPGARVLAPTGAPGAYLSGRHAVAQGDVSTAADLFLKGLRDDPGNPDLEQQAFLSALMANRSEAVDLAKRLPGNLAAQLVLGNAEVKAGNWMAAENRYGGLVGQGITQVLQPLLVAWVQQGAGHTDAALATLRPLVEGQQFRAAFALHAAMIADLAGRDQEASRLYQIARNGFGSTNLQLARALASWQARQGHLPDAQQTLAVALPALYSKSAQPQVHNAREGIAEAYLAVAGALQAQDGGELALVLLHLALDLRPDLTAARLLSADILDAGKQPRAAADVLAPVADDDPLVGVVRLRQAALSERSGKSEAALAILGKLATAMPDRPEPYSMEGDILRGQKRFAEAVAAYDKAVARIAKPDRSNWPLFYERGIALERANNWPRAEADFMRALELSPDEPDVLNYLGYSWTEQNHNLPRARQMIQRAVDQRPNDGSIIDSLGWVTLRQGDVRGAVKLLERAVELTSEDSTVNMHLGDAYWAAGRKLEAQFQWRRALNLTPDPDDVPKLRGKLRDSEQALGNLPPPKATP